MTDVFDDLAKAFKAGLDAGRSEYADEIERLRAALRPFVEPCVEHCHETCESEEERMEDCICFKARAALGEKE